MKYLKMTDDNYKAWDIKTDEFRACKDDLEKTNFFVRYGILAPSVHNSQPWIFKVDAFSIKISPDYKKALPEADPGNLFLFASIGACAETIAIAATHFGYKITRTVNDDKSVNLTLQKSKKQRGLVHPDVISQRFSNKFPYKNDKVDEKFLDKVIDDTASSEAGLIFIQDEEMKNELIKLHLSAVTKTMSSHSFVRELARYLIPNKSKSSVGMPGFVIGLNNLQSKVIPKLISSFPSIMAKNVESKDRPLVENNAGFGIIYSRAGTDASMIEIGGMYQRMSLLLKNKNIHNSMLTAIVLHGSERVRAENLLDIDGKISLFFRFGYSKINETVHTPRINR